MSSGLCRTRLKTSAYTSAYFAFYLVTRLFSFNGWNVTMIDSLDTMLLMGLHDEFAAALPIVQHGNFGEVRALFFDSFVLGGRVRPGFASFLSCVSALSRGLERWVRQGLKPKGFPRNLSRRHQAESPAGIVGLFPHLLRKLGRSIFLRE